MTGQVWIAVAVSAATSAIQVADGTMSWKQAAFQVGMSAATASLGAGAGKLGDIASVFAGGSKIAGAAVTSTVSAAGTTLLSNVTLEGGHIGVDEDKLTNWRTWAGAGVTAAAGTIANGYMTSDISRGLVNGTGSGISGGLTTGDWKDSMTDGLRGAAAGYLAGKIGGAFTIATGLGSGSVNNLANFGLKNLMGGDDKFSWDMVAQNNAIGDAIGGYLNNAFSPTLEETAASRRAEIQKMGFSEEEANEILRNQEGLAGKQQRDFDKLGFMDKMDVALGGMFLSMRDDMLSFNADINRAAGDIGSGLSYAANLAGGFAKRTGNLFTEGSFATDLEIHDAQQRQELRGLIGLNGGDVPIGTSYMQKFRETEEKMKGGGIYKGANSKAVEAITAKLKDGKPLDGSDLQKLTETMLQIESKSGQATLPIEILETIKNDPKAFEALFGKTFSFKDGDVKLDPNNPESFNEYAAKISTVLCVSISLYGQMVANGVKGTPQSFGEFTKQLIDKKLIDASKPAAQVKSTQSIIDAFAGKGKYDVVGYGVDAGGGYFNDEKGVTTKNYKGDIYNKLIDTAADNKDINFFNVRINSPHSMNLYNNGGDLRIYDTYKRGYNAPIADHVSSRNVRSWYYVKPIRGK